MTAATTGHLLHDGDSHLQERRRRCLSSTACSPTLVLVVVDETAPGDHELVAAWRDQPVEIHHVRDDNALLRGQRAGLYAEKIDVMQWAEVIDVMAAADIPDPVQALEAVGFKGKG